jgi:hypothetical protein
MVAVVLVCHNGELELKAAFLIFSLRKYLQGNYQIYLGIPGKNDFVSDPSPYFFSYCSALQVQIFKFRNPYLEDKKKLEEGDLVSNKIFVCCENFKEEYVVFLDTDTVLIREFNIEELVARTNSIKLKPANRANIRHWPGIYKAMGLPMPGKVVVSSIDQVLMPPYFNSGVIVLNREYRAEIIESWRKYFYLLSEEKITKQGRYPLFHRDQIALALAIVAGKLEYTLLEEKYNFPVRGKKIDNRSLPKIVHYHNPYSVYFEEKIKREFKEFSCLYPDFMTVETRLWIDLFRSSYMKEKSVAWIEYLRFNKYRLSQWAGRLFSFNLLD